MLKQTPLHAEHCALGATMVPFAGWSMPIHYGSQLQEHHSVRRDAGVFDVSHMAIIDVSGASAQADLQQVLANDVAKLSQVGQALYSVMLTPEAGVIDDLIVYWLGGLDYRLVVNAATFDKDLAWLTQQVSAETQLTPRRDWAMLAVQGPQAWSRALPCFTSEQQDALQALQRFQGTVVGNGFVARTGYTGEDGFEWMLPATEVVTAWRQLLAQGVQPIGLGARDTLRLEAGMNLYGQDMDESTSPLETNLGWTLAWEPETRAFIGRSVLQGVEPERVLVGVVLTEKGVLRSGMALYAGEQRVGELTSGAFSPTLGCGIGLARIEAAARQQPLQVAIRKKRCAIKQVKPCFVRHGQSQVTE